MSAITVCMFVLGIGNLAAFRGSRGNARGFFRTSTLYCDSNFDEALKYAQDKDSEWLLQTFGPTASPGVAAVTDSGSSSEIEADKQGTPYEVVPGAMEDIQEGVGADETARLIALDYSPYEIGLLKEKVRGVILARGTRRPRRGLPEQWTILANIEDGFPAVSRELDEKVQELQPEGDTPWYANVQEEVVGEVVSSGDYAAGERGSAQSNGDARFSRYGGGDDDDEDIIDAAFWPDQDEFKDMLLTESRFRVDLVGDWTAPFVKEETKWRYKLYKRWLTFLDEGLDLGIDEDEWDEADADGAEDIPRRWTRGAPMSAEEEGALGARSAPASRTAYDWDEEVLPGIKRVSNPDKAEAYDRRLRAALAKQEGWTESAEDERRMVAEIRARSVANRGDDGQLTSWFDDDFDDDDDEGVNGRGGYDDEKEPLSGGPARRREQVRGEGTKARRRWNVQMREARSLSPLNDDTSVASARRVLEESDDY